MSKKRRTFGAEEGGINMTPMIDIVFQMIIFFVCTIDLDKKQFDERIKLTMAPHGKAVEEKDPRTIIVEVNSRGDIRMGNAYMSEGTFAAIMKKTVAAYGPMPVVIRGDGKTRHVHIKRVMEICSKFGIWKVQFAAIKDKAKPAK